MRRHLVSASEIDESVQTTLMNVTRYGNSFGKSDRARAKWTRDLDFKPKDARREPVEYLWIYNRWIQSSTSMIRRVRRSR